MEDKGILIIAQDEYLPFLFEQIGKDLKKHATIWSVNDLFRNVGDKIVVEAIPYRMKKGISYGRAKEYVTLLGSADFRKNAFLSDLYDELLSSGRILKNPFGKTRLEGYSVYLFERQEDLLVHSFLSRLHVLVQERSIDSLKAENRFKVDNHPERILFSDKFHQFRYIFSDIRKRILENNTDKTKSDITIHISGQEDVFYLSTIGNLFGIPVIAKRESPFVAEEGVKAKRDVIYRNQDFSFTEEERKNPNRKALKKIIDDYSLEEISKKDNLGFSFAFANLLEILSHHKRTGYTSDKGIKATDQFVFRPNQIVYVTDFVFSRFYNEVKDKDAFTDEQLALRGANPSYVETNLDKRRKKNYLSYRNIILLSRVKQHLQDNIFSSPFLNERKEEKKKLEKENGNLSLPPLRVRKDYNPDGVYTKESSKVYLSCQRDSRFAFSKLDIKDGDGDLLSLNSYDSSFKGIGEGTYPLPEYFSVTNLESYILCPFKYYRENLIPDHVQDYFSRFRGTRIHAVFESINHKDFDFEEAFSHGKEALRNDRKKRGQEFDSQREAAVRNIRLWLKLIAGEVRNRVKENIRLRDNPNDAEQRIEFSLKDGDREYRFHGSIDKIIFSENEGRHFYTIVDYKTGSESFIPMETLFGRSIQLPLYAYAIEQKRKESINGNKEQIPYRPNLKSTFGGFAIQHIYASSPKGRFSRDDKNRYLSEKGRGKKIRFSGAVLEDDCYLSSRTKFYDDEGGIVSEIPYKKDNTVDYSQSVLFSPVCSFRDESRGLFSAPGKKTVDRKTIIQDSIDSALSVIAHLKKGEFPIQPTSNPLTEFSKDNLVCKYCGFKDVCYHKLSDVVNYKAKAEKIYKERQKKEERDNNG